MKKKTSSTVRPFSTRPNSLLEGLTTNERDLLEGFAADDTVDLPETQRAVRAALRLIADPVRGLTNAERETAAASDTVLKTELEQLRDIDKATREFVNSFGFAIPNGMTYAQTAAFRRLEEALFNAKKEGK